MSGDDQPRSSKTKPDEDSNKKLWEDLKIDFSLESLGFPDNKIYGTVKVKPESSRKLIKNFVLVVNKTYRTQFDSHYETLAASGFNTNKRNLSVYVQAIPNNNRWASEIKKSKTRDCYFTGKVFALSPTISFEWPEYKIDAPPKNKKDVPPKDKTDAPSKDKNDDLPKLVVRWYHIGDDNAHKYTLYLDGVDIQYIRQKQINDEFVVTIRSFECGEKHTFQLVARLSNGKETYRSDLMEFIVPDTALANKDSIGFITVLDEPLPSNLPIIVPSENDKEKQNLIDNKKRLQAQLEMQINNRRICTCRTCGPHDTFPGIEHYFNNTTNRIPPAHNQSSTRDKQSMHSVDVDDDDDLIVSNGSD